MEDGHVDRDGLGAAGGVAALGAAKVSSGKRAEVVSDQKVWSTLTLSNIK